MKNIARTSAFGVKWLLKEIILYRVFQYWFFILLRKSKMSVRTSSNKKPASTPTPEAAAVKVKKEPKAKKEPKVKAVAVTPAPVVAEPVVDTTTVATESTPVEIKSTAQRLYEANERFNAWLHEGVQIRNDLKAIQKIAEKEKKMSDRKSEGKKKRASKGPRSLSGFAAPARISDELAAFLGKPSGTEIARTDVTKEVTSYIKAHNLQNPKNGREIFPDAKLKALLKCGDDTLVSYFNLQTFMSPHYIKVEKPEAK